MYYFYDMLFLHLDMAKRLVMFGHGEKQKQNKGQEFGEYVESVEYFIIFTIVINFE